MSTHSPRTAARPRPLASTPLPTALGALGAAGLALVLGACGSEPTEPAGGAATGGGAAQPSAAAAYTEPPTFTSEVDTAWFERPPGERVPLDGIDGFQSISAIEYAAAPGVPHRLDVVYVFPDRARWSIVQHLDPDAGRILEYQFGGHRYRKMPDYPGSVELSGASLGHALRQMKLRETLMMYPHGLDWGPAETAGGETVRVVELGDGLGALRVVLDDQERPRSFTAITADGQDQETFHIDSWQELEGRTWPKDLRFEAMGEPIWSEIVKNITTRVNLVDRYFIPVDFKELPDVRPAGAAPRVAALPPMTVRHTALPASCDWDTARDLEAAARSGSAGELPLADSVSFTLGEDAEPETYFFRLAPGATPLEGWTAHPERQAVTAFAPSLDAISPMAMEHLEGMIPDGAAADAPYVTWLPEASGDRVQVVLPFTP